MIQMGHDYHHIIKAICGTPWAIRPEKLQAILEVVTLREDGHAFTQEEIKKRLGVKEPEAASRTSRTGGGTVAVVPVQGTISPRMSVLAESSGGVSLDRLTQTFRQAVNDPQVDSVVLDIHSPGGSVYGVQEFADEVFRARTVKPILAVANAEAASAAYWIGSAANEFSVIPSGLVGSIGVIAVHDDWSKAMETAGVKSTYIISSKFKAEGNPDEPLTDEGRAAMQKLVDDYDAKFTKAVARNRAVSVATVRKDFGEGRVMTSEDALRAGMVDRIGTFDQAVIRAGSGKVSVAAAQPLDDGWIQMRRHRLEVLGY